MANTPKKMKDPTEAALSAIQDALSVRDTPPDPIIPSAPVSTRPEEPAPEQPWRTVRTAAVKEETFDDEVRRAEDQGSLRRPANDDRDRSDRSCARCNAGRRAPPTSSPPCSRWSGCWPG